MAFKATTRQFDGVVYASDIKPCNCMIDYINGKGQFYVENEFYTPVKFTYDMKNKRPFAEDEYKTDAGVSIKTPKLLYNFGGKFYRKFSIVWNVNAANSTKQLFCLNVYNGWDKDKKIPLKVNDGKGKIKIYEIPLTSMNDFDDSADDNALALLTFHLTEAFGILAYAYIFDINLAADKYKRCTDNHTLYANLAADINSKLDDIAAIEIENDAVERYNDVPTYIKDPEDEDVTAMQVPAYYDGEKYKPLHMLQNFIFDGLFTTSNRGPKLIDGVAEKLSERKANLLKLIGKKSAIGNRSMLRLSGKDGEERKLFTIKGQFKFLNCESKEDRDKCAGLCTTIFDRTKKIWVPIDSEEYLMKHYRQKLSGDVYMSFEFKLGTTGKGTFIMKPKFDMFDVKILPKESAGVSGATLRAMHRIDAEEKIEAPIETGVVGDNDAYYDEISDDM